MINPTTTRPLRLLLAALLLLVGAVACTPFTLPPSPPTVGPTPSVPPPSTTGPTVAPTGAPTSLATAAPSLSATSAPTVSSNLPPPPTWVSPPTPAARRSPTPAALATAGPGAALVLPPEPAPQDVAPALRAANVGDLAGKEAWPRYQLALRLDPRAGQLWGHERLRVVNSEDRPLDQIVLRMVPDFPPSFMDAQSLDGAARLRVGVVQVDDRRVAATYADANTSLIVPLPTPLAVGASTAITFDFAFDLRELSTTPEVWSFQSFYPLLAVYDRGAWHEEVTAFPDRVYAESSFYAVDMTVPSGLLVVSSGSEVGAASDAGGNTTHHFRAGPVREFTLTACRPCHTLEAQAGDVLVRALYQDGDEQEAPKQLDLAKQAISIYSEVFGAYPFSEFDIVLRPGLGGGIEYPGLIYVGSDERASLTRAFLVAHETAHQWWYSLVGDDIFREAWLDEAFANYSAVIYAEKAEGAAAGSEVFDQIAAASWEPYRRAGIDADPHGDARIGSALWEFDNFSDYADIIYGKGSVFLQKVRTTMGDERFFAALQDHFAQHKYGVTTGRGLLATFLAHAGDQAPAVSQLYLAWIEGR